MNQNGCGKFKPISFTQDKEYANCLDFSRPDELNGGLIIGSSLGMKRVYQSILDFSNVDEDYPVLITGETGTGKELVARAIGKFYQDGKCYKFSVFNCASYPKELIDSELFGYEKGSFTGASVSRKGIIEAAEGGILFLDEVGNAPDYVQNKILRAVENKEVMPLGWRNPPKRVSVRIIAATNEDIEEALESGKIKKDMYHRLNTCNIHIPPLRERKEDIRLLADYFFDRHNRKFNTIFQLEPAAARFLEDEYSWPGNVRELDDIIKRIAATSKSESIGWETIEKSLNNKPAKTANYLNAKYKEPHMPYCHLIKEGKKAAAEEEANIIKGALVKCGWNRKKAAKMLDVSYKAMRYKIEKYKIEPWRNQQ